MYDMGLHLPMQITYYVDAPLDKDRVELLNEHLARSGLARSRFRSTIPFTPDYWGLSLSTPPVTYAPNVLHTRHDILSWMDQQSTDFPHTKFRGPSYRVAAANTGGNRSIISIIANHYVADGHGFFRELERIMPLLDAGEQPAVKQYPQFEYKSLSLPERLKEDISHVKIWPRAIFPLSLASQLMGFGNWVGKVTRSGFTSRTHIHTVFYDADAIKEVAKKHQGSVTSLLEAFTINLAHELSSRSDEYKHLRLLVSRRKDSDDTNNHVINALMPIDDLTYPVTDLVELKKRSKQAYIDVEKHEVDLANKKSLVLSSVGSISTDLRGLFPGTMHIWGRVRASLKEGYASTRMRSLHTYGMQHGNVFTVSYVSANFTRQPDFETLSKKQSQQWGLEELPLLESDFTPPL